MLTTALYNETQILQAERSNFCQLNYPTCEAKWDYSNEIQASETKDIEACFSVYARDNLDLFI